MRLLGDAERRLALALDATNLGARWTVLSVSVVIRGCAIPVAWKVLPSHTPGSWRPHWEGLLACLHGRIPADWLVLVLADRGLYAHWLFHAILRCEWHPFLRINLAAKARPVGAASFDWLETWLPQPSAAWLGEVDCFSGKRLRCHVGMQWEVGYRQPWVILTDLPVEQARLA